MTRRLVLSYLAIASFILVILAVPLGVFFENQQKDELIVDVERDARVLATIYEDTVEKDLNVDPTPADDYAHRTGARVVVINSRGISVVDTGAAIDRDFSTRPEMEIALAGSHATGTRYSETLQTDLVFAAVPIASGGSVHGAVRITLDAAEVQETVYRFWIGLAATALITIVAVVGVGWVIARSISRPLRRLQGTAERFAAGDLSTAATERESLPELVALERSMNAMATDLDDLIERQRRFVADASHQLRTPLTALRLRLENVEVLATRPDGADAAEEVEKAIDETDRLSRVITDLLRLATADRPPPSEPVNLSDTARDRVDIWGAIADENRVALSFDARDPAIWALAAPGAVEQVLDNLLENAIRASPPDSTIAVSVRHEDGVARVDVADSGEGLSDVDKRHAVERFWRADASTEGTGLGLAIVVQLIEAAGGSLRLSDNDPRGLIVTFTLPLARPDSR
jgi:signal transduction histidine kinase